MNLRSVTNLELVNDENGYHLYADSHNNLNRWKNYFRLLFNAHGINNVRQTELHTAEPLVPAFSSFEVEISVKKLKT
jgi:hypothetical protein